MLENVHRALDEEGDLLEVQDARVADLRRERRDAHLDKRVGKKSRIAGIIEDLIDRIQFCHRSDLGDIHLGKMKCSDVYSGCPGVKIQRDIGVLSQKPVEQYPGVTARCAGAILVSGPFPIHINEIDASTRIWAICAACLPSLGVKRQEPP